MNELKKICGQYKEKINREPDREEKIQETIKAGERAYMESQNSAAQEGTDRFAKRKAGRWLVPAAGVLLLCIVGIAAAVTANHNDGEPQKAQVAAASAEPSAFTGDDDRITELPVARITPPETGAASTSEPGAAATTKPKAVTGPTAESETDPASAAGISDFNYRVRMDGVSYTNEWDTVRSENITVDARYIGEKIGETMLEKYYGEGEDRLEGDMYAIQDISAKCAVVCTPRSGKYQNADILFIAEDYCPATWGEFKKDLQLEENLAVAAEQDECLTYDDKYSTIGQYNGDPGTVLRYLFDLSDSAVADTDMAHASLTDPYWYDQIIKNEAVNIKVYLKSLGPWGRIMRDMNQITVYDTGYLCTGFGGQVMYFYIGEPAARECIQLVKNSLAP